MDNGPNRTADMLEQLIESKKNLANTLISKGEEASFNEPFDSLVRKAGDYIPKSYVLVDGNGTEITGILVSQETIFDATENDVREGKTFGSELGVKIGQKTIPSYNTTEGYIGIPPKGKFVIKVLKSLNRYDFTKLQAIICPWAGTLEDSVFTEKVSIDGQVFDVKSYRPISVVIKDHNNKYIDFDIINNSTSLYVLRYFTYKEIY